MPPLPSAPKYPCPECDKRFGKPAKLEAHLLEAHGAELRLSPGRLHADDALGRHLAAAVADANAAFAAAPSASASCPRCPPPLRPFRNARALAQHLLIKHLAADPDHPDMPPANAKLEPVVQPASEISCNPLKRPASSLAPISSTDAKRSRSSTHLQPSASKACVVVPSDVAPSATGAPVSTAAKGKSKSTLTENAKGTSATKVNDEAKAKVRASTGAAASSPKKGSAGPSCTPDDVTPASGTKPPITPRKGGKCKSGGPSTSPAPVAWVSNPSVRIPVPTGVTTAPMDFSEIGGFAANSRKPYYRLTNR